MVSIQLQHIRLHAFHGLSKGEEKLGSEYELSLEVSYDEANIHFNHLSNTIDYVRLFEIVKERMAIPSHLLENVCEDILKKIREQYPFAAEATISLWKLQAPIAGFRGKVGVTIQKKFDDK